VLIAIPEHRTMTRFYLRDLKWSSHLQQIGHPAVSFFLSIMQRQHYVRYQLIGNENGFEIPTKAANSFSRVFRSPTI
jgi:hypothetical protein